MDLLSGEDINGTSALNQNFSSETLSAVNNKMRSACDGGFAWSVHGPLIVVCVLIIAFNSAVMALMRWKESLRTLSNTILVSLAVSDLISGLFGIPLIFGCSKAILTGQIAVCVASTLFMRLTAVSTVLHFLLVACDRYIMIKISMRHQALVTKRRIWCALISMWLISLLVTSVQLAWFGTLFMRLTAVSTVLHFLLVACDRYIMIKISMRHQALVTKRRIWCALISMWLISLLVTSVQLAWFGTRNIIKKDIIYFTVLIVAFLAVPLISILCIYAHIIWVSMRHLLALRARRANLSNEPTNTRSITRDLRGTLILISMLVIFGGCWLPFFLMILQDHIGARLISVASWRLCFLLFARFIPPVTNPIFCVFGKRDFRNAFRAWAKSCRFSLGEVCSNVFHNTS